MIDNINKDTIDKFDHVMEKYKFTEPLPIEVQAHIRNIKKDEFKRILKDAGGYSVTFGLIASFFFALKKLGLNITIIKSTIILFTSTAIAITSVSTGTYYTYTYIKEKTEKNETDLEKTSLLPGEQEVPKTAADNAKKKIITKADDENEIAIAQRIGIEQFSGKTIETNKKSEITDRIALELEKLLGKNRIVNFRKAAQSKKTGMIVMGSVENFEGTYIIRARVVRVSDSKILAYASETVDSEKKILDACSTMAKKVAQSIK